MNRVLYFDCFAGASGDMIIGSLLDLGVELKALDSELSKLALDGYALKAQKIVKSGFSAIKFDVLLKDEDHHGGHDLDHHHGDHSHEHGHHHHNHSRNLTDIVNLIEQSQLAPIIKEQSIKIFRRLAVAEAKIHGTVPEKIHFHEVGAVDAIVDIVGAVICLQLLQVDKIVVSPLPMGTGFVRCEHGTIPVPAPATMELLKGLSTYGSDHKGETVTPTGAAILSTLADSFGAMPLMNVKNVGYGAGTRDFGVPNLLRVVLGEESKDSFQCGDSILETVTELEANIDDMNPELYDYIFENLLRNGALDVFLIPIQMKKNRPANIIRVLCSEKDARQLAGILFRETTTLGVRINRLQRLCLRREFIKVQTEYGEITIKQALLDGAIVNQAPEYEDCKEKAREHGVSLKEIYNSAIKAIQSSQDSR